MPLNYGEAKCFTACEACWEKVYPKTGRVSPRGEPDYAPVIKRLVTYARATTQYLNRATTESHDAQVLSDALVALHDLQAALLACTTAREEAQQQVLRVMRGEFAQMCSYCGWESKQPGHSWEVLQEHIGVCLKHPLRKAEADLQTLRSALESLQHEMRVIHRSTDDEGEGDFVDYDTVELWADRLVALTQTGKEP